MKLFRQYLLIVITASLQATCFPGCIKIQPTKELSSDTQGRAITLDDLQYYDQEYGTNFIQQLTNNGQLITEMYHYQPSARVLDGEPIELTEKDLLWLDSSVLNDLLEKFGEFQETIELPIDRATINIIIGLRIQSLEVVRIHQLLSLEQIDKLLAAASLLNIRYELFFPLLKLYPMQLCRLHAIHQAEPHTRDILEKCLQAHLEWYTIRSIHVTGTIEAIALSTPYLVIACGNQIVQIRNLASGEIKELALENKIRALAISPDNTYIVGVLANGIINVWNTKDLTLLYSITYYEGDDAIKTVAISPDSTYFVINSGNKYYTQISHDPGSLNAIELLSGLLMYSIPLPKSDDYLVESCAISPNNTDIYLGTSRGEILHESIHPDRKSAISCVLTQSYACSMIVTPNTRNIVSAYSNLIFIRDIHGKVFHSWAIPPYGSDKITISPDGNYVAFVTDHAITVRQHSSPQDYLKQHCEELSAENN